MRPRGFDEVVLHDLPASWPVPRVGEVVQFQRPMFTVRHEPTWLVRDVLYTYGPSASTPVIVIKLHPEG